MPELTHLRISGLNLAVSFSKELEEAYTDCPNLPEDEYTFPSPKLPSKLQHLITEGAPELPPAAPKRAKQKNEIMMENLESLEVQASRRNHRTRFTFLERAVVDYSADDIRANWEGRLSGKNTCW
jgi:hypothetical protein